MSTELGTAQWAGREIQQRDYYYFYKGMSEALEQERAQLTQLEEVSHPALLKLGVATKFGGTMGAKWEMKPVHLIELALDADRIDKLMALVVFKGGEPDPDDPNGLPLILPKLKRFYLKCTVMAYRSFNEPTIRKWMHTPQEKKEQDKTSLLAKLLGGDSVPASPDA